MYVYVCVKVLVRRISDCLFLPLSHTLIVPDLPIHIRTLPADVRKVEEYAIHTHPRIPRTRRRPRIPITIIMSTTVTIAVIPLLPQP